MLRVIREQLAKEVLILPMYRQCYQCGFVKMGLDGAGPWDSCLVPLLAGWLT